MLGEEYRKAVLSSSDGPPFKDGHFARIPLKVLLDRRLSDADLTILGYLLYRKGLRKRCWPAYRTIAQDTGLSLRQVKRTMAKLQALGFVEMEAFPQDRRRRVYLLHLDGDQGPKNDGYSESQTAILVADATSEKTCPDQPNPPTEKPEIGAKFGTNRNVVEGGQTQTETASLATDARQQYPELQKEIGAKFGTDLGEIGARAGTDLGSEDVAESEIQTAQTQTCLTGGRRTIEVEDEHIGELGKKFDTETRERPQLGGSSGSKGIVGETEGGGPQTTEASAPTDWRQKLNNLRNPPKEKGKPRRETILKQIEAVQADIQATQAEIARLRAELAKAHPSRKDELEREIQALQWDLTARRSHLRTLQADLARWGAEEKATEVTTNVATSVVQSEVAAKASEAAAQDKPSVTNAPKGVEAEASEATGDDQTKGVDKVKEHGGRAESLVDRVARMSEEELKAEKNRLLREKEAIAERLMELYAKEKKVQGEELVAVKQEIQDLNHELLKLDADLRLVRMELERFTVPSKESGFAFARTRVQRADWPEERGRKGKPKPKGRGKASLRSGVRGKPPVKFVILASAKV